jgi:hypothetical protein
LRINERHIGKETTTPKRAKGYIRNVLKSALSVKYVKNKNTNIKSSNNKAIEPIRFFFTFSLQFVHIEALG